jgi:hypothetical protein
VTETADIQLIGREGGVGEMAHRIDITVQQQYNNDEDDNKRKCSRSASRT